VSSSFSKKLMVLFLCLAFVGQVVASTIMPYHMMSMKGMSGQEQAHDMSKMDHSGHLMTSDSNSDTSEESSKDCCAKSCSCFTGGCSSIALLIKDISNDSITDLSTKISSTSSLALSQELSSLYRPPILS
jgi:hypothetical protein